MRIRVFDSDPDHGRPRVMEYVSFEFTGPAAPYCLIGTEHSQRVHPRDKAREVHADIGEWKDVQRAKVSTRAKRQKCANGHFFWGASCMSCLPEVWCKCSRRVFSPGETECWKCRERGHKRTGYVEARAR